MLDYTDKDTTKPQLKKLAWEEADDSVTTVRQLVVGSHLSYTATEKDKHVMQVWRDVTGRTQQFVAAGRHEEDLLQGVFPLVDEVQQQLVIGLLLLDGGSKP